MKNPICKLLCLLGLIAASASAFAHKASDSFLQLDVRDSAMTGRWDIALRDLDYAIGLDANGDGAITWGEVRTQQAAISAHALSRLEVRSESAACSLQAAGMQISEHSDGLYAALALRGDCGSPPLKLHLKYGLMFELDALHRGLLRLNFGGEHSGVFAPERRELDFESGHPNRWRLFTQYLREGLLHVWGGLDHMLFLAGLFLPAVLRRRDGQWQPVASLRTAIIETAKIVTAFTIAHAITLSIAALGIVSLSSRLVESLVAATVMFAGLNNLLPMVHRRLFWLAGGFGLIHGAAIAGALMELGLPTNGRVWALLAFNLGVELAQLALVAVAVPLTYLLRHSVAYRRLVLVPGSVVITLIGLLWLIERAFEIRILGL